MTWQITMHKTKTNLESIQMPTSDIIIDSSAEYVHRVPDDRARVEQAT